MLGSSRYIRTISVRGCHQSATPNSCEEARRFTSSTPKRLPLPLAVPASKGQTVLRSLQRYLTGRIEPSPPSAPWLSAKGYNVYLNIHIFSFFVVNHVTRLDRVVVGIAQLREEEREALRASVTDITDSVARSVSDALERQNKLYSVATLLSVGASEKAIP